MRVVVYGLVQTSIGLSFGRRLLRWCSNKEGGIAEVERGCPCWGGCLLLVSRPWRREADGLTVWHTWWQLGCLLVVSMPLPRGAELGYS